MPILSRFLLFLALATPSYCLNGAEFTLEIAGGGPAAANAIVSTKVPADFPEQGFLSSSSSRVPFQKLGREEVVFIVPENRAGSFKVEGSSSTPDPIMRADLRDDSVTVSAGEKKIFTYQGRESALPRPDIKEVFKRGGYIHPIWSPSGKQVTDDYAPNHLHHHGIWFPWTKTEFEGRTPDFWNMGDGKGKVEFVKMGEVWSGGVHAGFTTHQRHVDLTSGEPKAALEETWQVVAYHPPAKGKPAWIFDLVSTQVCSSASPLKLPKYFYGGLGLRGNWAWNGKEKTFFLTSNGESDRVKANETRGNWCHMGGQLEGELTGIAVLCHPENFRAPQPMRVHPGEPFFCYAPSQLGDWAIEPGKPYVSRYRFVVADGAPDKAELDRLWESYAHPPTVKVQRIQR